MGNNCGQTEEVTDIFYIDLHKIETMPEKEGMCYHTTYLTIFNWNAKAIHLSIFIYSSAVSFVNIYAYHITNNL